MSIKEQNTQLADLKREFTETRMALDDIISDALITLFTEKPTELQLSAVIEYLYDNTNLKELRAHLKTSTCPPHIEKVPTQVSEPVKKAAKKVVKSKSTK